MMKHATVSLAMLHVLCQATHAAERVYFFVDDRWLPHFSNVPHDPRYRLWLFGGAGATRFDEHAPPLTLHISAPAAVTRGAALDVSLALPASAGVRGMLELRFEPAALIFQEATVEARLVEPGRLQVEIDPGIAAAFAADVRFAVREIAPARTAVSARLVDLESEQRRALRGVEADPLIVTIR